MYVCSFEKHRPAQVKCPHLEDKPGRARGFCPMCYKVYQLALELHDAEVAACPDCQEAERKAKEKIQKEDTIDPSQPWGQHITLTCKNHPNLRWHTKNISYISARTIFFSGEYGTECECSARDLIVVPNGGK